MATTRRADRTGTVARVLEPLVATMLGGQSRVAMVAWDGSRLGPSDASTSIVVNSPRALQRLVWAPGELGLVRGYVAGELDVDGDMFAVLGLRDQLAPPERHLELSLGRLEALRAARRVGALRLPPPPPPQEQRGRHGRRHSRGRDAVAVTQHYDVSNAFYRAVLGPSMTYSCALWTAPGTTLEAAQAAKHELVCRKLGLVPGMRMLDVGCGWGGLLIHAGTHHGISGVGVTLSPAQLELARARVAEAGLGDRVEIRLQDYRDVRDGPYDAISSIGMFEHVGRARVQAYFERCFALSRDGGRFLNHAIARVPSHGERTVVGPFSDRYVFPDAELLEVGSVVSAMHRSGFEVRHVEQLREHYALTLRAWVANLEDSWGLAVREVGEARSRVWRLYMAGAALAFEGGRLQVDQVLAQRPGPDGPFPARPTWEAEPLVDA